MSELKSTIAVEVDASGVQTGVSAVKKSLADLGEAATSAGVGFNGVSTQVDEALKKADRSTKAFVAQVKNAATDIKAEVDKLSIADKFELKAVTKGLDPSVYKPYVEYLRTVSAAQDRMATSANGAAMSARAMTNAMRGVPAQFTDIVTSLASGQSAMTVLMQQGGQLKDMFGGVGNAAKALGGYISSLLTPINLTVAAVGALGFAYYKGTSEATAYNKALVTTGNAAGATSGQLADMAERLARMGVSQGAAAQALAAFAATGQIAATSMEKFTLAAVKYASATGVAVEDTVKQFTELGKAPLDASIRLDESANHLTLTLYEQIKALDEQGRHTEAATVAQNAFADAISNRSTEMVEKLGYIEKAWAGVKKEVVEVGNFFAGVGREKGLGEQVADQQMRVLNAQNNLDYIRRSGYGSAKVQTYESELQAERDKLEVLRETERLLSRAAASKAQEARAVKDQVEFDKDAAKYKTNAIKLQEELNRLAEKYSKVTHEGELGAKNAAAYLVAVEKLKDQYKEKSAARQAVEVGTYDTLIKSIREKIEVQTQELAGVEKLTKGEREQAKFLADLRDGTAGLVALKGKSVQQQAVEIVQAHQAQIALERQNEAIAKAAAMQAEAARAADTYIRKQADETAAINAKAQSIEDEVDAYGKTKEALRQLTIARLEDQAAQITRFEPSDVAQKEVALIEARIAAIKRLGAAETARDVKEANAKAAENARKEWQKTADKINDSITDALMRGFESGKGFAENLRDTVVNMFKTMVLRPTVSAIVNPVAQGITGAMGFGGTANATGNLLGTASNAYTAYGTFAGGASAFGSAFSAGAALGTDAFSAGVTMMTEATGASSFMAGAGQALGAIGPAGWAALAAIAVLSLQDHGKPTSNTGNAAASFDPRGNRIGYETFYGGSSANVDNTLAGLQAAYLRSAAALGIGTVGTRFSFGGNTGKNGESPNFALGSSAGGVNFYQGETSLNEAALGLAASRAVFAALQGSDLPKYISRVFDGLSASAMTQEQIDSTLAYAQSLKQVREALLETREPLQILKDNVAQGFATLATSADTFKADFVAAIDAGISPERLAQWQGLQSAMTELAAASGKASDAVKAVTRSIADIANERQRLQDQLDELTMTSTQLLEKQRNAIDDSNKALFDQVQVALRAKAAVEALNQAMADLAAANSALESARQNVASAFRVIQDTATAAAAAVANAKEGITAGYLAAQEAVANAQTRVAELANESASALTSFAASLSQFMLRLTTTDLGPGSKAQQLAALKADFAITAAQARAGDAGAVGSLTDKAGALLTAGKGQSASALEFARLVASVSNTLNGVAAMATPQTDAAGKAQQDLASAQAELARWANAAAVSGASTAKATTDYLAEWRIATAANVRAQADLLAAQQAAQGIDTSGPSAIEQLTVAIANFGMSLSAQLHALATVLANMRVSGTGGSVSGPGTYTGTQAAQAIAQMYASGSTTPQVINAANVNLGVTSDQLAQVAAVAGYPEITAYQQRIDSVQPLSQDDVASVVAQAVQRANLNSTSPEEEFVKYLLSIGWNAGMGDKAMGWPNGTTNAWATANGFPAFAVGTNYVPRDMLAQIHEGEAIVPKAYNPAVGLGGRDLLDELRALRAEVAALRVENGAENRAIATNTGKVHKLLDRAMPDGDAIATREVTA